MGELPINTWFGGERMDQCNHFRRICKSKCRKTVDLDRKLESGAKLGYRLCAEEGRPSGRGGVELWAQPIIKGCVRNRPPKPALVHRKLCCGHTTIQMEDATSQTHVIMAFGWNPDCQASTFVLGPWDNPRIKWGFVWQGDGDPPRLTSCYSSSLHTSLVDQTLHQLIV